MDRKRKDEERKYVPVLQRSREQIENMLRSGVSKDMSDALWSAAYYDPDWRWVQTQCLVALTHAEVLVRRSAATCLGLLAVFHKKSDTQVVIPALKQAGKDPEVQSAAEDSLADIQQIVISEMKN